MEVVATNHYLGSGVASHGVGSGSWAFGMMADYFSGKLAQENMESLSTQTSPCSSKGIIKHAYEGFHHHVVGANYVFKSAYR